VFLCFFERRRLRGYSLEVYLNDSWWDKAAQKNRTRHISFLGLIRDIGLGQQAAQFRFWERALAKLDTLELKPRKRQQIERGLEGRIPRPGGVEALTEEVLRRRWHKARWAKAARKAKRSR
jgi:hypothetical protein